MTAATTRCLITAGPTREFFDPVRFMSNPSSGKMGYALADAALERGWTVELVSGPVAIDPPGGEAVRVHPVITGQEMFERVDALFDECDLLIKTAAVMDYRPAHFNEEKLKKTGGNLTVEMVPVIDILRTVAARKRPHQRVVGFAAETGDVVAYARGKLVAKNCDFVVGNRVGDPGVGFESDDNLVTVVSAHTEEVATYGPESKASIARSLIALFAAHMAD